MRKITNATVLIILAAYLWPLAAAAQMSSRPYSFSGPGGRGGMSVAGKQAILNQKFFGVTPPVLLRSEDGRLLGLTKGRNNLAVVSSPSGELIPAFRGRSFRGNNPLMRVGAFNAYFVGGNTTNTPYLSQATSSAAMIDNWTGAVVRGGPGPYGGGSVGQWTSMVYYLR